MQQLPQRPAGAITRQHIEVVNVHIAVAVCAADLGRVHVRKPVIGQHLAGNIKDQAAQRVALVGIGVDPPVLLLEILVDRCGDIDHRLPVITKFGVLLAVDDVGARGPEVPGMKECQLDRILDLFNLYRVGSGARRQRPR